MDALSCVVRATEICLISRSSYLSIVKNNGKTTGHIYEYTTYEGSDKIKACVDFYVENGYVSVVGNKSSGMIRFGGYKCIRIIISNTSE